MLHPIYGNIINYLEWNLVNDIRELTDALLKFRDERDWAQFHNAKDLALALSIEASELLESFLWKPSEQADIGQVEEELADVFAFSFLLAEQYGFDVKQIVLEKIKKNALKYPVEKSKGIAKKYTEL
jgi:NTP pyrophosphatase (non-canonical NTP hydrolase)